MSVFFYPVKGSPKNLDRSARPIAIEVRTEPGFSTLEHDSVFNRGVASSQAYSRRFDDRKPDKLPPEKQAEAREWLSRSLDEALLNFISNAKKNDTLLCCFYEFRYLPVATAIKEALDRGVNVQLIIDGKVNEKKDKKGKFRRVSRARRTLECLPKRIFQRQTSSCARRSRTTSNTTNSWCC